MLLNAVCFGYGSHESAWRTPISQTTSPLELSHWISCASDAEAAGFDGLFIGDILCLQDRPESHPSETLDPFMVLAAAASATKRIRLTGTASTSFNHPWHIARRILSLHHLSGGRAGWNIVTSSYPQEALNFGWKEMPETAQRYALAQEVVDTVLKLWNSWDNVDRVRDQAAGQYLSHAPSNVEFSGRFRDAFGAVNLSPSPYARPLLAQAGSSAEGMAFAARYADQIFTVQSDKETARAFRTSVREQAAQAGRNPNDVKVLPGVVPFVARTRSEADEELAMLSRFTGLDHTVTKLARFIGTDLSGLDLDQALPFGAEDMFRNTFSNSRASLLVRMAHENRLTLRQLATRFAAGRGHLLLVGTGEEIALTLQDWVDCGAADGFNVMPPQLPSGIEAFGKMVIPYLSPRTRPLCSAGQDGALS